VARQARDLLDQIESDVLDDSKPVAAALRKCVVLGGRAGSAELREWAARELHGYLSEDLVLPDYRRIPAELKVDGLSGNYQVTGEAISVLDLPEFARDVVTEELELRGGVGEIEAMIRQADSADGFVRQGVPGSAELARLMTSDLGPYRSVSRIYRVVAAANLRGAVDSIRTVLAELIGELRAGMTDDEHLPSPELAGQAVQVAVHGKRNRVTVASAHASAGSRAEVAAPKEDQPETGFWTTSRRIGAAVVGLAGIVAAAAAVLALHPKF
jgi:hypothetical protein